MRGSDQGSLWSTQMLFMGNTPVLQLLGTQATQSIAVPHWDCHHDRDLPMGKSCTWEQGQCDWLMPGGRFHNLSTPDIQSVPLSGGGGGLPVLGIGMYFSSITGVYPLETRGRGSPPNTHTPHRPVTAKNVLTLPNIP